MTRWVVLGVLGWSLGAGTMLPAQGGGIVGKQGPAWDVTRWVQLPPGQKTLEVDDFRGRALCLFSFQSW